MEGHSILSKRCAELLLQSCEQIGPVKSKYESGREKERVVEEKKEDREEDDRQWGDEEEKESDRKEGENRTEVDRT